MYSSVIPATGVGALAFTGTNSLWYGLAAFALIAAGTAMVRILPRREE